MHEALVTIGDAGFEALGGDELVALCRSAGIVDFEELVCHGTGSVVQVEVETSLDEDRLQALEYVTEWSYVQTTGSTHLYVIAFTTPGLSETITDHTDELIGTCEPELRGRGATLSLVGSQDAIAGTIREYENDGITPALRKLGGYGGNARFGRLVRGTDRSAIGCCTKRFDNYRRPRARVRR